MDGTNRLEETARVTGVTCRDRSSLLIDTFVQYTSSSSDASNRRDVQDTHNQREIICQATAMNSRMNRNLRRRILLMPSRTRSHSTCPMVRRYRYPELKQSFTPPSLTQRGEIGR